MLRISTSGFVGYKKNGIIKGFYNMVNSQYGELGLEVLGKFNIHSKEELKHFFTNKLNLSVQGQKEHLFNQKYIWRSNWLVQDIKMKDDHNFLYNKFCSFGYVYNLDDDTLDLYRGFFKHPQTMKEQNKLKIKKIFIEEEKKFYTHLVYSIKRDEIERVEKLFLNWNGVNVSYEGLYKERDFMEQKI